MFRISIIKKDLKKKKNSSLTVDHNNCGLLSVNCFLTTIVRVIVGGMFFISLAQVRREGGRGF